MDVLVDSNVLLRIVEAGSQQHATAVGAINALIERQRLLIVPQIAYEFWVVATRTVEANGLGRSVEETDQLLHQFADQFPILRDERGVLQHWWELVRTYRVRGTKSHDARIVAAMRRHGIRHLLTFNGKDFVGFRDIEVLVPEAVVESG